jgi:2-amino-4-hydroxy-6-hydroxymethyldihydropteridine diphosphokinase
MNDAVISIGSNIFPEENIPKALESMEKEFRILSCSSMVQTAPVGYPDQPDFTNGVVRVLTGKRRRDVEKLLKRIEDRLGRIRTSHKFGPRRIDLDLVVWNGKILSDEVYERGFLKKSVQEVWPELRF